jgi:glycosyltransferase involved in cell wall biosynthesis
MSAVARATRRRGEPDTRRIYFLMVTVDGTSGVPRTVLTLANELVERHDVEIISVYRRRLQPAYPVDPRITLTYLHDQRPLAPNGKRAERGLVRARNAAQRSRRDAYLDRRASKIFPDERELSLLTDVLLLGALPRLKPGILITVRPALHLAAVKLAPPHMLTVAQDHLNFPIRMSRDATANLLDHVVHSFDALAALTAEDAADYAERFPAASALITSIPNASSWPAVAELPPLDSNIVISAGRFERRKGFDRLIAAYAPLARTNPDWQLHIYGRGNEQQRLEKQIAELGVGAHVKLMGFTDDLAARLSEASIYAMASVYEGFPMVLLEAMSRGLPMVSYDCPRGPGELIDDGQNGFLVDDGDTAGLTAALARLMDDFGLRRRLAQRALADVDAYTTAAIAQRWEELFGRLLERRRAH